MRIDNLKVREDLSEEDVCKIACKKNKIKYEEIKEFRIIKKSIDARSKDDIYYSYSIELFNNKEKDVECKDYIYSLKYGKDSRKSVTIGNTVNLEQKKNLNKESKKSENSAAIVGAGPAGLFCALRLIQNGMKPIIIEQGKKVEDRQKDVNDFVQGGKLNPLSNVQFGEGGAGTFSDGKLTSGLHNPLCKTVLKTFLDFGAPKEVEYINKPHIGTDNLIEIIKNIRNYIIEKGGEFLFEEKFVDFELKSNKVVGVKTLDKNGKIRSIKTKVLVLAIGHSARSTFEKLYENNIEMQKKNFSVGVRIEHKQEMINKSQYGIKTKLKLPPAEYKLVYHGEDRDCYTFCMCPGGSVIASSSEEGTIVTNGMSKFVRDGENANSALLVNVTPDDFKGESPLEGIYFQKKLEEEAFILGGRNYFAPIQRVEDFLNNKKTEEIGTIKPTYKPGVTYSNLQEILPEFVVNTLKQAIPYFDNRIKGFAKPDAILTGIETRSSSPVTIIRDKQSLESNVNGVYPCGEGAGYAGGIMSAAIDGIKVADAINLKYLNR